MCCSFHINQNMEIRRTLKEIYPPWLVLLVFSPVITGYIIDHELSDSRYILINLVWIPVFTIPYMLSGKKIIYYVAAVLFFLTGLFEIGHWIILKGPVTLTSLLVISNTNLRETVEFFDLKASAGLLILIPYIVLFYFTIRRAPELHRSKIRPYIAGAVLMFLAIFIFENTIHGRLARKGTPQVVKVVFSFIEQRTLYREAMQDIEPRKVDAKAGLTQDRQTFVLILGESCSRRHMSLYGSSRKTNPELEKRNDLVIYDDVVSPYSNTLNSVLSMLSESNLEEIKSFENSVDIIDVFHSAGFKTYWISNQSPIGIWDNLVTVFAKKSDHVQFVNTTGNTSFEATLTSSFDSRLFKPFSSALDEDAGKKFIVLHLMGSHSAYSKRYPAQFDIFTGTGRKEKTIAEYDNSILYNDFIVDSLMNMIISKDAVQNDRLTSVIYISDHGENVYDEGDNVGHDYAKELPAVNVEVPFLVWLSPAYTRLYPEKAEIISRNRQKPFVADDLFHAIMDLNGIRSPYLQEERSIFSKKFNDKRLRILEDGRDYDR